MTRTRLRVLARWLAGKKNQVGLGELIRFLLAPSYASKAKALITRTEETDDHIIVHIQGLERPLFYPKDMTLDMLTQVVVETFDKSNWHYYQVEETKVEAGDVVVDCGAAEGLFSLTVAARCKKVFLVEPLSRYVKALSLTFRDVNNVESIACALADAPGQAFMRDNGVASSLSSGTGQPVRIETIDTLFHQRNIRIDYLKVDLEGHDFKAIAGARKTIEQYHPKIAVTTYHDPEHARLIAEFIVQANPRYKIRTKGIYQETGSPVMLHAWCP